MLYGDMSRAIAVGSSRELTLQTSAERFFELDQLAVRCTERVDINCHGLGDGATGTAGAVVALVGTT